MYFPASALLHKRRNVIIADSGNCGCVFGDAAAAAAAADDDGHIFSVRMCESENCIIW